VKSKKRIELILNTVFLIFIIWFGYTASYELFINEPGVHFARIQFSSYGNGVATSKVLWNVPTLASLIILIASIIGIFASIIIFVNRILFPERKTKTCWIVLIAVFSVCLLALLYWIFDFFGSAFGGVG